MKVKPEWIIILIMAAVILLQRACGGYGSDCPEISLKETKTDYPDPVYVSIPRDPEQPEPVIRWMEKEIEVQVPADVDTMAILTDYFRKFFYSDTINGLDTGRHYRFSAVINDSISQNRIFHRDFQFLDLKPVTVNTYEVAKPRNKWFIGGQIGGNVDHINAGVSLLLLTKKDHAYAYTYQAISNTHNLTVYWKISFRRDNN